MSINTLAEYRTLFKNRHGVECPLTDAQIRTAFAGEDPAIDENAWPLAIEGLTAIEAAVGDAFPEMDISRYNQAGTLLAPQDLALDNEAADGFDVNFSMPTGGNPPYSIQLQLAPDDAGSPGTWANEGNAQDDNTEIVVSGLDAETIYHARLQVTDNLGEDATSNVDSIETAAA